MGNIYASDLYLSMFQAAAPPKRTTLSTPGPPQKKARVQDSKQAPASAPSKMHQKQQQQGKELQVIKIKLLREMACDWGPLSEQAL
jgi:hypothetical protein